jgi:hypothetical protein
MLGNKEKMKSKQGGDYIWCTKQKMGVVLVLFLILL